MWNWHRTIWLFGGRWSSPPQGHWVLPLLLGLLAVGLLGDGFRGTLRLCGEICRPKEPWRQAVEHGLAVSMNALGREKGDNGNLPLINIRGAVFDWQNRDWIIWGDKSTSLSEGLPVDALRLAVRGATAELEPPGVDIRPSESPTGESTKQKVTYFGGVESTVVGQWFFNFDYWMKSAALGQARIPVPEVLPYAERLEREAVALSWLDAAGNRSLSHCRFWLKNGKFMAVEDKSVMVFKSTPMLVCAERMDRAAPLHRKSIAAEDRFAADLTTNLHRLETVAPVLEIEEFAKLLATISWLAKVDPYRDLTSWRNSPVRPAKTERSVATLRTELQITPRESETVEFHRTRTVELSGGVEISFKTDFRKAKDKMLCKLGEAILLARPTKQAVAWDFSFSPNSEPLSN